MRPSLLRILSASLVLALLLAVLPSGDVNGAQGVPRLYVFHPTLARPLAIQEALARRLPGVSITVFGRLADFHAKVAADAPDALLALPPVLKQYDAYQARLQGLRRGQPAEPYVLLSIDKAVDPARMDGVSLGVVGLLERKPMADFVQTLVKGTPRLDRVTKVEDLLPLLTFRTVSAVLVSEPVAQEFRKKSQANLVTAPIEAGKVGLVSLAVRKGAAADDALLKAVKGLQAGEMDLLGVDAWK